MGRDILNSLPIREVVKACLEHLLGSLLCYFLYLLCFCCSSCPGRDMFNSCAYTGGVQGFFGSLVGALAVLFLFLFVFVGVF